MDNNECMLTTFDNPFNPFEQFVQWRLFDIEKGYYTCEYLARIAKCTICFDYDTLTIYINKRAGSVVFLDDLHNFLVSW